MLGELVRGLRSEPENTNDELLPFHSGVDRVLGLNVLTFNFGTEGALPDTVSTLHVENHLGSDLAAEFADGPSFVATSGALSVDSDDSVSDNAGVKLVVDPVSLDLIAGSTVDFFESLGGAAFRVENPQAAAGCGCGSSFGI